MVKIMKFKYISPLLILPFFSFNLYEVSAHEEEKKVKEKEVKKSELSISYIVSDDLSSSSSSYGTTYGHTIHVYNIKSVDLEVQLNAKIYGEYKEKKIGTTQSDTEKFGIELANITIKSPSIFEPYAKFGLESIREKITTPTSVEEKKFNGTFKYTIGLKYPINDKLSLDLYHSQNYDDVFSDKLASETSIKFIYNFLGK